MKDFDLSTDTIDQNKIQIKGPVQKKNKKRPRQNHSQSFKDRVVKSVLKGKKVSEAIKDANISSSLFYTWRDKYLAQNENGPASKTKKEVVAKSAKQTAAVSALQAEIQEMLAKVDVLRKAVDVLTRSRKG